MKNILVYPCGTDDALEINKAIGRLPQCRLFGIDNYRSNKGRYIYLNFLGYLEIDSPLFIEELQSIINNNSIDLIFPASSNALIALTKHRDLLDAQIVAPEFETCTSCLSNDKMKNLYNDMEFILKEEKINNCNITICCFTDRNGQLKYSKNITVDHKANFPNTSIERLSKYINTYLQLRGPWSYKLKVNYEQGRIKITPGIIPEMALCRIQGVNLSALSFFDFINHNIEIKEIILNYEVKEIKTFRYKIDCNYDSVYIDLDDTILIHGKINSLMVAFIFQCLNESKRIHLITKHHFELWTTLANNRLEKLFDSIYWLKHFEEKYRYIRNERAIFIDDSYVERKKVEEKLGIPTFEVSAIECLMDWRL